MPDEFWLLDEMAPRLYSEEAELVDGTDAVDEIDPTEDTLLSDDTGGVTPPPVPDGSFELPPPPPQEIKKPA